MITIELKKMIKSAIIKSFTLKSIENYSNIIPIINVIYYYPQCSKENEFYNNYSPTISYNIRYNLKYSTAENNNPNDNSNNNTNNSKNNKY